MSRRSVLFLLAAILSHPVLPAAPVVGEGKWKFEVLQNGIALPAPHGERVQDYHGVSLDMQGRVYVAYYTPESKMDDSTRTLARFHYRPDAAEPFSFDRFLGDKSWVAGRVHGLNSVVTPDGEERLLLVYNRQRVILCDLDGRVDKKNSWIASHREFGKATDGQFSAKSNHLGVYDGYASNLLHEIHVGDGKMVEKSHGGKGKGPGKTSTAHGLGLDHEGRLVVADRGNQRLMWLSESFDPIFTKTKPRRLLELKLPGLEVCNVSFARDGTAVVPCLNAKIAILKSSSETDCGYELDVVLTMPKELVAKGYDGVHDANFTHDLRYLVVAVWQRDRKVAPQLFSLKRLPAQ